MWDTALLCMGEGMLTYTYEYNSGLPNQKLRDSFVFVPIHKEGGSILSHPKVSSG